MKRCADAFVPSEAVNVLIMRIMCTDKMETERGARTYVEVPLQAKCRIVVQGPRETLGETEQRDTSSPTLPEEAPHVFFTIAVSMGWIVQQGDVEAAFLNGLRLDRELILQAPREGLPAIPGVMEAVPGGAYFQALKGVYGINDAPNLWGGRHADGMLENGATESTLAPRTLFWWFDRRHCQHERVPLIGMVGTHVDDDLFAGN